MGGRFRIIEVVAYLGAAAFFSACGPSPSGPAKATDREKSVERIGSVVAKTLMESLGSQLKAAMESGGPAGAVQVCRQVALPLTEAAGLSLEGVSVRRTSLKTRNPINEPDAVDREVLEVMAGQSPPQVVVRRDGGMTRYYEPLVAREICLKCHGDPATFPEELASTLASLYPEDAATGYVAGDLRGAIRVEVTTP